MAVEIERKFLVRSDSWRTGATGIAIRQGYLASVDACSVRVRLYGERAYLTVKGDAVAGVRAEYEYEVPTADAAEMLDTLCRRPLIEKVRYPVPVAGRSWVVDVFSGDNAGLVVAEVELESIDAPLARPDWAGTEVTNDPRYLNVNLARHPFSRW